MLDTALDAGSAHTQCTFEVFTRRLPVGRRYGVFAGVGRLLDALKEWSFTPEMTVPLIENGLIGPGTAEFLHNMRFTGSIWGYAEGELFFPHSPVLTVRATFAECILLETLVLSILNHDSAIASAGSRMVNAAAGTPLIEMGGRRTHEHAAVAAARAAYIAGFDSTSNVAAGLAYGIPTAGTAAHAFTLLYDDEREAFAAQVARRGTETTLLVDTYDTADAIGLAIDVAGPELGGVRIDSGDLAEQATAARNHLDARGATDTRIVATGDLDEMRIDELKSAPIDTFGVGTRLVTGSGYPTAGMVYKIVEKQEPHGAWTPVAKASPEKETVGGRKWAARELTARGVADREIVASCDTEPEWTETQRPLTIRYVQDGAIETDLCGRTGLAAARERHAASVAELPTSARALHHGLPACQTTLRGLALT